MNPINTEAYNLLHEGLCVLSHIEQQGIRVDTDYIVKKKLEISEEIKQLEKQIYESGFYREWSRTVKKGKINIYSGQQLSAYLYKTKGLKIHKETATGQGSTDEETLRKLGIPELDLLLRIKKLKKIKDTYLKSFEREAEDGQLHPFFNLHTVRSFRSSSDRPNFQNIPARDQESVDIVRRAIYPRKGHQLLEVDYGQLEVRIAASYCKDERLIHDILKGDMHRDMAMEIFKIDKFDPAIEGHSTLRKATKNGFVFPQFYGDYYENCAEHLACVWGKLPKSRWEPGMGVPVNGAFLSDHLISKGIRTYKSFVNHIHKIETDFWEKRYFAYNKWRETTWKRYQRKGYVSSKTGFVYKGLMKRNDVLNYPIQGCLQKNARILTDQGLIPIFDLVGKKVNVWTGFKWAKAVAVPMGEAQLAEIKLNSGIVIKCDVRHKIKNEKNEWVSFTDIKKGDYVALPKLNAVLDASPEINWEFVLGFLIGDGYLMKRKTNYGFRKSVILTVGEKKKDDLEKIQKFISSKGFPVRQRIIKGKNNIADKYQMCIENKKFVSFLENMGIVFGSKAHTKKVPFTIWQSSAQQMRDFLEGLWKSDGSRGKFDERNLHMCNKILLQEVQILASVVGFDSVLCKTKQGFLLRISYNKKNKKPHRKVPYTTIKTALKNGVNVNNICWIGNDARVEKRNLIRGKDISQYVAERLIKRINPNFELYRYDRVKEIKILDRIEETYTMSVEDTLHQFVADGVITKNSAFHCLLWSLIEIVKAQRRDKWDTKVIGQIHDSIVFDAHPNEVRKILKIVECIMCNDVRQHWPWIIVPLEIDAELSPVDGSWADKKSIKIN